MNKETKEEIIKKQEQNEQENNKNENKEQIQNTNEKTTVEQTEQKSKKKTVKKVFNIIKNSIMVILIIFCIIILIRAVKYKTLDIFGLRFYTIMSGSMEPEMYVGDVIITKTEKDINVGDVIAFKGKNNFVTVHRIVDIVEDNGSEKIYQTKGDNNNANDPFTVNSNTVQGKYIIKVPYLGDVIMFLKQHLIIVIAIVTAIILISIIRLFIS